MQSPSPKRTLPVSLFPLILLYQVCRISLNLKKNRTFLVTYKADLCHWIFKKIGPVVSLGNNLDLRKPLCLKERVEENREKQERGLLPCGHRRRRKEKTLVGLTLLTGWSGLCNLALDIYLANKNIVSIVLYDHKALFVENVVISCPIVLETKLRTVYKHFFLLSQNHPVRVGGCGLGRIA